MIVKIKIIIIAILTTFLFIGGTDNGEDRVLKQFWETGHFVLFFVSIFTLLQFNKIQQIKTIYLFLLTGLFCIIIGFTTEFLQKLVGRNFQILDVINDTVGGYAGLLLYQLISSIKSDKQNKKAMSLLYFTGLILLSIIGTKSFLIAVYDKWNIYNAFPIISNFEGPLEVERWDYFAATLSKSKNHIRHGKYAMKIRFSPSQYPRISLEHFIRDWGAYNNINFSVFNSQSQTIVINAKIYDNKHIKIGANFSDRFNQKIILQPGWNDIEISLSQVKKSPAARLMNLNNIRSFSLFMIDLKQPSTIYLDDVYLN